MRSAATAARRAAFCLLACLGPFLVTGMGAVARAERAPSSSPNGAVYISPAECATYPTAVFVEVYGRGFCIRYYVSNEGGEGDIPIVFLEGDKVRKATDPNRPKEFSTKGFYRYAAWLSRVGKTTGIYIARPGVDGSSGHHTFDTRFTWLELMAIHKALDAIKRRHGFRGFHVVGQSGGARLAVGLLGLRDDLVCVVPGSGPLDPKSTWRPKTSDRTLARFSPYFGLRRPARFNSRPRIIVIGDPRDTLTSWAGKRNFVRAFRAAGARVQLIGVTAADPKHHGVTSYAVRAAGLCAQDYSDQEIVAEVRELQERILEAAERKRQAAAQEPRRHATRPRSGDRPPTIQPPRRDRVTGPERDLRT